MPREATAKKRSFSSYKPSKDKVKSKAAGGGSYDNYIKPQFKKYKIKDGKNLVRVLPPTWEGADYHALDIHVNYGIGPDNSSYLSLSKHGKGKDPIAEARNEANREGDDEYAKKLQPRSRRLMWIIDRMDEDEGPQVLDAPITLDKHFANLSCGDEDEDNSSGIINFVDITEGRDIRFYREGKGKNAKYEGSQVRFLKPSPLSDDDAQAEEWFEYVKENPLPDCLQFYSYDHIAQMFDGSAPSRGDDDEDEKPRKKARPADDDDDDVKPRKKAKPVADEDEDDDPPPRKGKVKPPFDADEDEPDTDDDSDDDDPDDDDKKPVRARSKRAPVEDDEDEDEPAPKKGGSLRDKIRSRRRSATEDDDE